jgi:methylated-DNA-protein-cysteine methyltransferase-like protein
MVEKNRSLYEKIYAVVRQIPRGKTASYGQIAKIVGRCGARNVGYAMAALSFNDTVPWHRVINSKAEISPRSARGEESVQRQLLEAEGVRFDHKGRVNLEDVGWDGAEV